MREAGGSTGLLQRRLMIAAGLGMVRWLPDEQLALLLPQAVAGAAAVLRAVGPTTSLEADLLWGSWHRAGGQMT